jgi:hypothetical protein
MKYHDLKGMREAERMQDNTLAALREAREAFDRILKLNWTERQTGGAQNIAASQRSRIDAVLAEHS